MPTERIEVGDELIIFGISHGVCERVDTDGHDGAYLKRADGTVVRWNRYNLCGGFLRRAT